MVSQQLYLDREPMLKAVTLFLEKTAKQFRFMTVPELLQHGRPQRQNWYRVAPAAG
jgi:hypothetical protein